MFKSLYYKLLYNTPLYSEALNSYLTSLYHSKYTRLSNKDSVDCLTSNLIRYVYYDLDYMYVSGVRDSYKSVIVNGKKIRVSVSEKTTRKLLCLLEEKDLIVRTRGCKVGTTRKLGYFAITDRLKKEIESMVDFNKVKLKENGSSVVLRSDTKELLEFSETSDVREMIRKVNRYNKLMYKTEVSRIDINTGEVVIYPCQAVRIFSRGDFQCNGRYYLTGGSVQTLSGHLRGQLLIDGESVVEPDLKGLHLALAGENAGYYWMEGFDPYNVYTSAISVDFAKIKHHQNKYNKNFNPVRNFLKVCVLIMINSKSVCEAKGAIEAKIKCDIKLEDESNKSYVGIDDVDYDQLFFDIKEHHQEIEDVFFSDSGIKFMRWDSDIIGYILDKCVKDSIPCIPIHDSIICKEKDLTKVIQYMKEGYKHVMGSDNNCVIEVK